MGRMNVARIDRKSSIETEPRTLNFRQIDIAREAALYVMHTRSREEACQIFTEGLEAVDTVGTKSKALKFGDYSDEDDDEFSPSSRVERRGTFKDVFTAPF